MPRERGEKKKVTLKPFTALQNSNWELNTLNTVIQISPLVDDRFSLLSKTETQTVCRRIKLKRWLQSFPGFKRWTILEKIRIFYISLQLRSGTVTSSQVDPECSGWSNTIAAFFFFFFHISHFFSSRFFFLFHLSLHIMHNRTNTHAHSYNL